MISKQLGSRELCGEQEYADTEREPGTQTDLLFGLFFFPSRQFGDRRDRPVGRILLCFCIGCDGLRPLLREGIYCTC